LIWVANCGPTTAAFGSSSLSWRLIRDRLSALWLAVSLMLAWRLSKVDRSSFCSLITFSEPVARETIAPMSGARIPFCQRSFRSSARARALAAWASLLTS
jgi:hypothetical protein